MPEIRNHSKSTLSDAAESGATGTQSASHTAHYVEPGWFTRNVFNRAVARLTRVGLSIWGSRVLEVRGRSSGRLQRVPVNVLNVDGDHYLVSPRGEGQWVRNVRAAAGHLDLLVGRRRTHWVATEVADADKTAVLRGYLAKWKIEVGMFFEGVDADSSDSEIEAIASRHPVFVLRAAS